MRTLLACLILGSAASSLPAQSFSLNWFTIDGGGGTSSGGPYSVQGTIGQPEAGELLSGGPYTIQGGFWGLPISAASPTPSLTIDRLTADRVRLSWVPAVSGFVLQESQTLSPANWVNSASGSLNPTVLPSNSRVTFYRVIKP